MAGDATIVRLGTDAPVVYIDAGRDDGVRLGARVCMPTPGQTFCGKVIFVGKRLAGVKVEPAAMQRLKRGIVAQAPSIKRIVDPVSDRPAGVFASSQTKTPVQEKASAKTTAAAIEASAPRSGPSVTVAYLVTPILPIQFNVPKYDIAAEIAGVGPVWTADQAMKRSVVGVALSSRFPLGGVDVAPQLAYRFVAKDKLEVDYDRADPAVFASGEMNAFAVGLAVDAVWPPARAQGWSAGLLFGVGADLSRIAYDVVQIGGSANGQKIASFDSDLTAFGARAGGVMGFANGSIRAGLSMTAIAPLSGEAKAENTDHRLKPGVAQESRSETELERAIDHRRAAFGAEVTGSLGVAF